MRRRVNEIGKGRHSPSVQHPVFTPGSQDVKQCIAVRELVQTFCTEALGIRSLALRGISIVPGRLENSMDSAIRDFDAWPAGIQKVCSAGAPRSNQTPAPLHSRGGGADIRSSTRVSVSPLPCRSNTFTAGNSWRIHWQLHTCGCDSINPWPLNGIFVRVSRF